MKATFFRNLFMIGVFHFVILIGKGEPKKL